MENEKVNETNGIKGKGPDGAEAAARKAAKTKALGQLLVSLGSAAALYALTYFLSRLVYGTGGSFDERVWLWTEIGCVLFFCVCLGLNLLLSALYVRRMNAWSVSRVNAHLERLKEKIRGSAAENGGDPSGAASALKGWILAARLYTAALWAALCAGMFFIYPSRLCAGGDGGWIMETRKYFSVFFIVVAAALFLRLWAALTEKPDFSAACGEDEYPALRALVREAARRCGIGGKLHLYVDTSNNAGIGSVRRGRRREYLVSLGLMILDILTEEETFNVLLHEFAHMKSENRKHPADCFFCDWLLASDGGNPERLKATDGLLALFRTGVAFEAQLYGLLASEFVERAADGIVMSEGDPDAMARALVKIAMTDRFLPLAEDWDNESFYAGEEFPRHVCTRVADTFRRAFPEKQEDWIASFRRERQPKNATHPIPRERLAALGRSLDGVSCVLPDRAEDTPFRADVRRGLETKDGEIFEEASKTYAEDRQAKYLEPLEAVNAWEAEGRPCDPETGRDVLLALDGLGRKKEAEELCTRMLDAGHSVYATAYFIWWLGLEKLKHDDPAGLELTYRAMELNDNAIDSGIDAIGSYCCRMGLTEEYDEYRRRAEELLQKQKDVSEERGELRASDRLVPENFSGEKLRALTGFMAEAGEGHLTNIYLVRKLIGDDFTSAFVIEFDAGSDDETKRRIYGKIFVHLDSDPEDWQYSLFIFDRQTEAAVRKVKDSLVWHRPDEENAKEENGASGN